MYAKILNTPQERFQAYKLLHEVYVQEQSWEIPKDNPSKLITYKLHGQDILTDKYDEYTVLFGVVLEGQVIACARLIPQNNPEGLEVFAYSKMPQDLIGKRLWEVNRLAIHRDYRGGSSFYLLAEKAFNFLYDTKTDYLVGTTIFPVPGNLYTKRLGFDVIDGYNFKYHENDPEEVCLIKRDFSNEMSILERINTFKHCANLLAKVAKERLSLNWA